MTTTASASLPASSTTSGGPLRPFCFALALLHEVELDLFTMRLAIVRSQLGLVADLVLRQLLRVAVDRSLERPGQAARRHVGLAEITRLLLRLFDVLAELVEPIPFLVDVTHV